MAQYDLTIDDMKRFLTNIVGSRDGCWNWEGRMTSDKGNGTQIPSFRMPAKTAGCSTREVSARRISYAIHFGEPEGVVAMICNNQRCVNPLHMHTVAGEGSRKAVTIKTRKKQQRIDEKVIRKIILLRRLGRSLAQIKRETGVSPNSITNIVKMARLCREGKLGNRPKVAA